MNMKPLEKQTFHYLVIREKKNKDRDDWVKEVHNRFHKLAKVEGMDNYTMMLHNLMERYDKHLMFDELYDMILANQLAIQTLQDKLVKTKEESKEVQNSTF